MEYDFVLVLIIQLIDHKKIRVVVAFNLRRGLAQSQQRCVPPHIFHFCTYYKDFRRG